MFARPPFRWAPGQIDGTRIGVLNRLVLDVIEAQDPDREGLEVG